MIKFEDKVILHPNDKLDVVEWNTPFEVSHGEEGCKFIPVGVYSEVPITQYLVVRDSGAFYLQQYEVDRTTFKDLVEINKIDNHCEYDEEVYVRLITVLGLDVKMSDKELWSN